jgi:hypothetical protein
LNIREQNIEFEKLRKDYKIFLCIFFIGATIGILQSFLIPNTPDSIGIWVMCPILYSLGWLFCTVKFVINTLKVFKIIKPSNLQIGISIFLFWFFLVSPLVVGLYTIHLIDKYKQINRIPLKER